MNLKRWIRSAGVMTAGAFWGALCALGMAWGMPHGDSTAAKPDITITGIEVMEFQGHPVVRVSSDGILDYFTYEVRAPEGIVVQLPGASLGSLGGPRSTGLAPITKIQAVQKEGPTGPMAEIVIALEKPVAYGVVSESNQLFVHLEAKGAGDAPTSSPTSGDQQGGDEPSAEVLAKQTLCKTNLGGAGGSPQVDPFGASAAESLRDVVVVGQTDGTRVVLFGDGEISKFNTFTLESPKRVVLDVWGVASELKTNRIPVETKEVARVRIGPKPDKVRLVFDVAEGLEGFPPYSVGKEKGKVILCLGDMAKKGETQVVRRLDPGVAASAAGPGPSPVKVGVAYQGATPALAEAQGVQDMEEKTSIQMAPQEGIEFLEDPWMVGESFPYIPSDAMAAAPLAQASTGAQAVEVEEGAAETIEVEDVSRAEGGSVESVPSELEKKEAPGPAPQKEAIARVSEELPPADRLGSHAVSLAQLSPGVGAEGEEFPVSTGMEPGKAYVGQRINLDFQDIDIHNVFRLLAEVSNLNIIVSDKVKGKMTMRLRDVPWDQALDLVLSTQNLGMVKQGNIIRVAPLQDLVAEEQERRRARQDRIKEQIEAQKRVEEAEIARQKRELELRPFDTTPIVLNYTSARDIQKQIRGFLTAKPKKGSVVVDERTNIVTISDYPEVIAFIKDYIERVDRPTPQVMIEARIVKASKNFARELGVQWGGQYAEHDPEHNWAYGISGGLGGVRPSTWTSGDFTGGTGWDFSPLSSWMVNLPATLFGAGTPALGLQVGRLLGDIINLDLRLSAAEAEGLTKIISRPKIMTLDNVEATIKQGFDIPYTQVNPEGRTSVVWKQAELKTTVTPLVSPDGRVRLKLEVTDDFPDPTITSAEGEPSIRTRQAFTEVLVRNGDTVVIGGILEETRTFLEEGVPWFRDIPLLSWLFERKRQTGDQTELLIFVTPFIVEGT